MTRALFVGVLAAVTFYLAVFTLAAVENERAECLAMCEADDDGNPDLCPTLCR